MDSSPNLTLPYIIAAQAQKHVTHNEAIRTLDALVQLMVLDKDLASPPGSPADGNRYIVAASPAGAWAGQAGKVAAYQDGTWEFFAPRKGWLAWVADEDRIYAHNGTAWAELTVSAGSGASTWGINATADTTNRLAVKSTASLFDNVGNGHQQKINKNAAGDTASTLYQTGYSGRAEYGLTGDDDFHVKVSPNGSTWYEALVVDRTTGAARFPNTAYLDLPAGSAPATPASGKVRVYAKTDKSLYQKDDAGLETGLAGGASSSTLVAPQGRLTLASGTPVTIADQTAKTTIYHTPHVGAVAPFWDGTSWTLVSLAELSLALDSNAGHTGYHQAGKLFCLWLDYNAGSPRLVTGPAWTNDSTPAVDVTRQNGIKLNASSMTVRFGTNSGDTATIAASRATYLGTFRASADGQAEDSLVKRFLWNAYDRRPRPMRRLEATDTWTYTTDTFRQANNSASNQLEVVRGQDEDAMAVDVVAACNNVPAGMNPAVSIGLDSTTAGVAGVLNGLKGLGVNGVYDQLIAAWRGCPGRGYHYFAWLERSTASGTTTWVGDVGVPDKFQCGIHATVMT